MTFKFTRQHSADGSTNQFNYGTGIGVPGITTAAMNAVFSAGNFTFAMTTATPSQATPVPNDANSAMSVYRGLSTQLAPNPPSTTANWVFPTDQQYGGSSGTSVMSLDINFQTAYPETYEGVVTDWDSVIRAASSQNSGAGKIVTKTPAQSSYSVGAYTCSTLGGTYPWVPQGNGSVMCSNTGNITIVDSPNACTPVYKCDVPDTYTTINEALYCLMDGTGTIRDVKYINGVVSIDSLIPTGGSDASAIALLASVSPSNNITMGPGDIGFMTVSNQLGAVSNPHIDYPDSVFNWQSVFDQSTIAIGSIQKNTTGYTIQSAGAPPAAPAMSFSYPQNSGLTPEQLVLWYQWAYPPMNTRIPFQNYVFSVPDVIIRK